MKILGLTKEKREFKQVPSGVYKVELYKNLPPKKGRIQMIFKVIEGEYKGGFCSLAEWPEFNERGNAFKIPKNSLMHKILKKLSEDGDIENKDLDDFIGDKVKVEVRLIDGKYSNIVDIAGKKNKDDEIIDDDEETEEIEEDDEF